jgi:HSP20 family protein
MVPRKNGGAAETESQQRQQPARWSPFALIDELQDELARFWGRSMRGGTMSPGRLLAQLPLGAPRLDVFEKDGYLVIKADLPGVKKDDMQVELEDGALVIQGEARAENEVRDEQYYRMERAIGRFYRRVPLPFDAKPEDVQATMSDGVLEVRIPKPAESKPRGARINIK